jgi:outer membrane receptor protein involved in Fe transport
LLHDPIEQLITLLNPVGDGCLDPSDPSTCIGLGPQNAQVKLDQHARDYALFGQAEHRIFDEWYLIGGLRFDIESKRGDASSLAHGRLIPIIAQQQDHITHIERIEHQLSPKAGFKWSPNKHVEAYGTWTRGFKSGGFNALPLKPDNLEYEPERATSIEIGGKVRVLEGALRFSGAVFTTDFDNLQVSTFQNNSFIVENAASARSRGFEIDLHWLTPLTGLAFYTSVGLADARYKSYPCAPAPSDSTEAAGQAHCHPSNSTGNPVTDTAGQITGTLTGFISPSPPTQDLSGHPLAFAPKWTATVIPSYTLRLPRYMTAVFAIDVLYRSIQFLNPDNDPRKMQPGTTQINARIGLGDLTKNWKLTFVGHNLTDKVVLDQAVDEPLAPGGIAVVRSDRGRFYSANLVVTF